MRRRGKHAVSESQKTAAKKRPRWAGRALVSNLRLFVAQALDGIQLRSSLGGIVSEQDSDTRGKQATQQQGGRRQFGGVQGHAADCHRTTDSADHAQYAAN